MRMPVVLVGHALVTDVGMCVRHLVSCLLSMQSLCTTIHFESVKWFFSLYYYYL